MKNRASALFVDSIYWITYISHPPLTVDAREFIQEGNLPFLGYFLAKELHEWLNTRRKWKFIQKYMKKNIQKSRWQISRSIKDHFAGENGVCEISQVLKKGCEITSQQQAILAGLRSWLPP